MAVSQSLGSNVEENTERLQAPDGMGGFKERVSFRYNRIDMRMNSQRLWLKPHRVAGLRGRSEHEFPSLTRKMLQLASTSE